MRARLSAVLRRQLLPPEARDFVALRAAIVLAAKVDRLMEGPPCRRVGSALLQVSGGWVYAPPAGAIDVDASPRHDSLIDLINENERKVIVYVPFKHTIAGLSRLFEEKKIDHAVVHGDITGRFANLPLRDLVSSAVRLIDYGA
jgi:hypothetical protein